MRIQRIDHVHVEVPDREAAARWYGDVLGLVPAENLKVWAEHPQGPLILATQDGLPVLSLFAREAKPVSRDTTIAFRVIGLDFLKFLDSLEETEISRDDGAQLTREDAVDHDIAWSIYFTDPWGNRLEITSYDYDLVANTLKT